MNTNISKGNWKVGNHNTVVTDNGEGFPLSTGHNDTNWYGGYLIAESILKYEDARLIAAAPELLEAFQLLMPYIQDLQAENFTDSAAGIFEDTKLTSAVSLMNAAIAKATGEKEEVR